MTSLEYLTRLFSHRLYILDTDLIDSVSTYWQWSRFYTVFSYFRFLRWWWTKLI